MLPTHWVGNRFLSLVTNMLYSTTLSDMETCYKVFDAQVLEGSHRLQPVRVRARDHGQGAPARLRIYEVPISYAGREHDEGKKITWRDGFGAMKRWSSSVSPGSTERDRGDRRDRRRRRRPRRGAAARSCVRSILAEGASPGGGGRERRRRQRRRRVGGAGRRTHPPVPVQHGAAGPQPRASAPGSTGAWPHWPGDLPARVGPRLQPRPGRPRRCAGRAAPRPRGRARPGPLVGPRIFTETGEVYPSVRNFPSFTDAAGHALLALFNPENPFTLRYNPGTPEGDEVPGRAGSRARASWPGAARSRSWAASTRPISCTSRTRTCAGGPTTPAGAWASPAPPRSPTSRASSTARHPTA